MDRYNFIMTKNKDTAQKLTANGYQLFSKNDDLYIFVNDICNLFAQSDKLDLVFTNNIFI